MEIDAIPAGKVLLSGASGMLGQAIERVLAGRGAGVVRLVRHAVPDSDSGPDSGSERVRWTPEAGEMDGAELDRLERSGPFGWALHLSGANVSSRRWTAGYKREMRESRVGTTRVLADALRRMKSPPGVLVSASAVGFYGDRADAILDESSAAGEGYFPELCSAWEAAARPAEEAGIRVAHLRLGVVIGREGGILARLAPLFRLGLGGRLGDGRQWMSWVSEADAVAAMLFALGSAEVSGAVNATSPQPVTNAEFTAALARAVHRPAVLPAPRFALRLAFGEMADEALLASTRAVPALLLAKGFAFAHPSLPEALEAALGPE